mgnify:CR=1 FL=1
MATVKMKTTVKMRAKAECPSHSLAEVMVRDLVQPIDEPVERQGTNKGPTPTETAVSALIGCTNVIAHKCAAQLGVDIGHLNISAVCTFDRRGVTLEEEIEVPFQAIDLAIVADGSASEVQLQAVAAQVTKFCPLSKLFRNSGTEINETWSKA